MSCASVSNEFLTHSANARQRQLLVETSDLDRRKPVLVARTDHGVEATLDPLEHLRVPFQDRKNLRIGLFEHTDRSCQTLRPVREAGAVMRCAEKHHTATTVQDALDVCFWSLLRCSESLKVDQQLQSASRSTGQLTSSHTRPPRLWQMKIIGRSSCCCESGSTRRATMNAYSVVFFSVASHSS